VGAVENVDRVQLDPADVLHEAAKAWRGQRGRVRPGEVLALEEKRRDGAQRNAAAGHAAELIIVIMARPSARLWLLGVAILARRA